MIRTAPLRLLDPDHEQSGEDPPRPPTSTPPRYRSRLDSGRCGAGCNRRRPLATTGRLPRPTLSHIVTHHRCQSGKEAESTPTARAMHLRRSQAPSQSFGHPQAHERLPGHPGAARSVGAHRANHRPEQLVAEPARTVLTDQPDILRGLHVAATVLRSTPASVVISRSE
jgi:hypothetical protein